MEPLALYLLSFPTEGNVEEEASKYVTLEPTEEQVKNDEVVASVKDAIQGAEDIIAEIVSDEAKYRKWIRSYFSRKALLASEVKDITIDEKRTYEMYYKYEEPISEIKAHRILALNRGESEKVLKVFIKEDQEYVLNFLCSKIIFLCAWSYRSGKIAISIIFMELGEEVGT